jgi:uncharacterized spore protein YtfJ
MNRIATIAALGRLVLAAFAIAEDLPPRAGQPAGDLAGAMASRLSHDLHVKTVVVKPVVAGSLTLIPILMVDVSFGGAGLAAPAKVLAAPAQQPELGGGFFMTGEARPLGFVAITRKGTRFIAVAKAPAQ